MFSKCKLRVGYTHFVHWNEFKQSRLKSNDTVCLIWWSALVQPKEYDIRRWETVRSMDARICLMDLIFTFSRYIWSYIWSVCYSKRQKVTRKICVTQRCMYNRLCRTLRVNATKTKDQKKKHTNTMEKSYEGNGAVKNEWTLIVLLTYVLMDSYIVLICFREAIA